MFTEKTTSQNPTVIKNSVAFMESLSLKPKTSFSVLLFKKETDEKMSSTIC